MGSIGDRIRRERERLELTQTELSDLLGTTRKTQFNYETDARRPDADYLAALAAAGADVRYVLTGQASPPPQVVLSAEERLMLDYFREAPPAIRKAAMGALLSATPGIGGTQSQGQSIVGNNAIQIGSVGSKARIKNR